VGSYVKGINNNAVGYEQGINEALGVKLLPKKK
jgi:hypothetical protein